MCVSSARTQMLTRPGCHALQMAQSVWQQQHNLNSSHASSSKAPSDTLLWKTTSALAASWACQQCNMHSCAAVTCKLMLRCQCTAFPTFQLQSLVSMHGKGMAGVRLCWGCTVTKAVSQDVRVPIGMVCTIQQGEARRPRSPQLCVRLSITLDQSVLLARDFDKCLVSAFTDSVQAGGSKERINQERRIVRRVQNRGS